MSGIRILGNKRIADHDIVAAMKTKPEGFWWFKKGAFDEDKFAGDLGDRLPELYGRRGYIDFQVVRDTMIVDRANGKALVEITVAEGPQYRVGEFSNRGQPSLPERGAAALLPVRRLHTVVHGGVEEYRDGGRRSRPEGRIRQDPLG